MNPEDFGQAFIDERDDWRTRYNNSLEERKQSKFWAKDYYGFESIMDFQDDFEDALKAIVPSGEWEGKIKITLEYVEEEI